MRRRSGAPAVVAMVAWVLLGALAPAITRALTREEAREALADRDSDANRRRGAIELGLGGTMDDVPLLARALHDHDRIVRALTERALWQIWSRSGDPEVDRLFETGVQQMSEGDGDAAAATFTQIIERRPGFAEGWNKRATVYYLIGQYQKSLADCDEVMKRNPYHFGALSGYGMIYLKLDDPQRALEYFDRALGVNPNLDSVREAVEAIRHLLIERRKNTL
jgi:tetratricopeptide (TPR) repeat protein